MCGVVPYISCQCVCVASGSMGFEPFGLKMDMALPLALKLGVVFNEQNHNRLDPANGYRKSCILV